MLKRTPAAICALVAFSAAVDDGWLVLRGATV